jgi:HD-like signal output (HDOD) protein
MFETTIGQGANVILKPIADRLRHVFRSNMRSWGNQGAETAQQLEDKVLTLVDNMPTLPDTAMRAMAMANDPNCKLTDFTRLIEGDAAITTGLLRISNSPLYGTGGNVVGLPQAVVRLGMWQCKNLIVSVSVRSLFRRMTGNTHAQCTVLWHHGYVTAYLCRQLNRTFRLGFDGEEFSAGLLHDLGRILLVLADSESATRAGATDFQEDEDNLQGERAAIGIDHCALGSWFGEHSRLPESLNETMRHHHEPLRSETDGKLVALVATADHLANHLQRGEEIASYDPGTNFGLAALTANWSAEQIDGLLGALPDLMTQAEQAVASEQPVS